MPILENLAGWQRVWVVLSIAWETLLVAGFIEGIYFSRSEFPKLSGYDLMWIALLFVLPPLILYLGMYLGARAISRLRR